MRSYSSSTHDSSFDVAQLVHSQGGAAASRSTTVPAYPATDLDQTKRVDSMVRNNLATGIQAKFTIGEPNDQYEREADRVASQVMSMSEPATVQRESVPEEEEEVQTKPVVQRDALPEEEEEPLQMKSQSSSASSLEDRVQASKGGGSPLSQDIRGFMEPRFGADFSRVRVHTGEESVQMNRGVGAQAFAHGNHIYYGAGKSPGNDELTAHELTCLSLRG